MVTITAWTIAAGTGAAAAVSAWAASRALLIARAKRLAAAMGTATSAHPALLDRFPKLRAAWQRLAGPIVHLRRGGRSGKEYRDETARAVPFLLDLLVVAIDGGLNLFQAIDAVAEHLPAGPLRDAVIRARHEMRLGRPVLDALEEMAQSTPVDEVRSLVRTLRIGHTLGTPVAATLRQSAHIIRQRRRQRLDEQLGVLPLKMTLCALFLFFPPLFVLLLLPNVLSFIHGQW